MRQLNFIRDIQLLTDAIQQAKRGAVSESSSWTLDPGVFIIEKPQMKCPFCSHIWTSLMSCLVRGDKVVKMWIRDQPVYVTYSHPHVGSEGLICFGSCSRSDPSEPLVTAINPRSSYVNFEEWLYKIGHYCEERRPSLRSIRDYDQCRLLQQLSIDIEELQANEEAEEEDLVACDWCGTSVNPDGGDWHGDHAGESICQSCHDDYATYCDNCEAGYHVDDTRIRYIEDDSHMLCDNCLDTRAFKCNQCFDYRLNKFKHHYPLKDVDGTERPICTDCIESDEISVCLEHGNAYTRYCPDCPEEGEDDE